MKRNHQYTIKIEWTGNKGSGTFDYRAYSRDYIISNTKKEKIIEGSSDSSFYGTDSKYNPEDLLIASISSCHMLWYLHLCVNHGIIVMNYIDRAKGIMQENKDGSGRFTSIILKPIVTISTDDSEKEILAMKLHQKANEMCFIANSCNFKIQHEPTIKRL